MALKYLIEFGYIAQRLSVYIVTSQLSIPYSFQTTDMQSTVCKQLYKCGHQLKLNPTTDLQTSIPQLQLEQQKDYQENYSQMYIIELQVSFRWLETQIGENYII